MQYRHMHDCPRAEITSRTQDNTNAQNQNATKIYGYAQRHGAGYGSLAFPCCGASHGNLLSPSIRRSKPSLRWNDDFSCQCSSMVPLGAFNAVHRVC